MGRTFGVNMLMAKKFVTYDLAPEWIAAIGEPERNFKAVVFGKPGQGKTTFVLKLCIELCKFGKVYYNSVEQGEGKSLQDVARLIDLSAAAPGSIVFGDRDNFEEMLAKLKKNRCKFVVLDSRDYLKLTKEQYIYMTELHKKKCFIIICWETGGKPNGRAGQDIEYMADIKIHVKGGVATTRSRFGPTKPYKIFEKVEVAGDQLKIVLQDSKSSVSPLKEEEKAITPGEEAAVEQLENNQ